MEGIFQQVIWKVLVSGGPLNCQVIWGTCGIVPEERIPSSANAFDHHGVGAGQRTHGPEQHGFNKDLQESLWVSNHSTGLENSPDGESLCLDGHLRICPYDNTCHVT